MWAKSDSLVKFGFFGIGSSTTAGSRLPLATICLSTWFETRADKLNMVRKMLINRRIFVQSAAGSALLTLLPAAALSDMLIKHPIKAVAFDAFPIFDPRPISALVESTFPGRGPAVMEAWRLRQFEYQWLRALSGQYVDFLRATRDSLVFVAKQLNLEISRTKQDELMSAWSNLPIWPDAADVIKDLHDAGLRLAFLSNMTSRMLTDGLEKAKLEPYFEAVISTDEIRSYKPDHRTYQLGVDRLKLRKEEILFVAFAGWDVAGAKWFGYPTFWMNRFNQLSEELGVEADATGSHMGELLKYVLPKSVRAKGNA